MHFHKISNATHAAGAILLSAVFAVSCDSPVDVRTALDARVEILSGGGQVGLAGTMLPQPLALRLLTAAGIPIPGQLIEFAVTDGGGEVSNGTVETDAEGVAQDRWTLGETPGVNRLQVRALGLSEPVVLTTYTATAVSDSTDNTPPPQDTIPPGAPGHPELSFSLAGADSFSVQATWTAGSGAASYDWATGMDSGGWDAAGEVATGTVTIRAPRYSGGYWICIASVDEAGNRSQEMSCNTFTAPAVDPGAADSTLSLSPTSASVNVGDTFQFTATARDEAGAVIATPPLTWTTSNPDIATVDSVGRVTTRAVGTVLITVAAACCSSESATLGVRDPNAPGHPNEPAGLTVVVDRSFSAEDETDNAGNTWRDASGSGGISQTFSIVSDPTSPHSPGGVGRIAFPTGFSGDGVSMPAANVQGDLPNIDAAGQQLYIEFWFKISDNWFGHTGGQNKIFYVGHPVVVEFGSPGSGNDAAFNWTIALQGGEIVNLRPTTAGNRVSPSEVERRLLRDTWTHLEILLVMNDPGRPNGEVHMWQNGAKIMEFTGRNILANRGGQYDYISSIRWHPIYGGQDGANVPQTQYQFIDHIFVSSRR